MKQVDLKHYQLMRVIGEGYFIYQGAFGVVKLAKTPDKKGLVAIKCLKKYELIKNKQIDHVHNEILILS
jgi:serine/threonine protein kinase